MNEIALQVGPENNLVAVMTPATSPVRDIAVLLLNAGVIHRIGPHRTNVKLARRLAADGLTCVRFDISGIGDSRAPSGAAEFRQQAVADIKSVMDHVEQQAGIRRFVLFGICAGAVNAHAAALADPRVIGAFLVDGYLFPTWKTPLFRGVAKLRSHGMMGLAQKVARKLFAKRSTAEPVDAAALEHPTRAQFAADLQALDARGVRIALMTTGSFLDRHSYATQWHDLFRGRPFLPRLKIHFDADIDHTMTTHAAQQHLLEAVATWSRSMDAPPSGPAR